MRALAVLGAALLAGGLAHEVLGCVAEGRLFLFGLPGERGPSLIEIEDAAASVQRWRVAGVVVTGLLAGGVCAWLMHFFARERIRSTHARSATQRTIIWLFFLP